MGSGLAGGRFRSNVPPKLGACRAAGRFQLDTWPRRSFRRVGRRPGEVVLAADCGHRDRDLSHKKSVAQIVRCKRQRRTCCDGVAHRPWRSSSAQSFHWPYLTDNPMLSRNGNYLSLACVVVSLSVHFDVDWDKYSSGCDNAYEIYWSCISRLQTSVSKCACCMLNRCAKQRIFNKILEYLESVVKCSNYERHAKRSRLPFPRVMRKALPAAVFRSLFTVSNDFWHGSGCPIIFS